LWLFRRRLLSAISFDRALFRSAVGFGLPLVFYELAGVILLTADRALVRYYLGAEALGYYSVAYGLSQYVNDLMTVPLGLAILPIYLRLWTSEGRARTTEFLHVSLDFYLMAAVGIYMLVTLGSHDALLLLASPKYLGADRLIPYLVGGLLIYTTHVFLCAGLLIQKKTGIMALALVCSTALNVVLNCLLLPRLGLQGAAVALLLTHIVTILLLWLASSRILPIGVRAGALAKYGSGRAGGLGGRLPDRAPVAPAERRVPVRGGLFGVCGRALTAGLPRALVAIVSAAQPAQSAVDAVIADEPSLKKSRGRGGGLQMTPRVSVIVPAYNAAVYLPHAIDSVLAQTYPRLGNRDCGRRQHRQYARGRGLLPAKLQDKLQYIHQPNRGLSGRAEYRHSSRARRVHCLLDADDVWLPHRLERGRESLDADPETGLVHARVVRIDTQGTVTGQLKVEPNICREESRAISTRAAPTLFAHGHVPEELPGNGRLVRRSHAATEDRDLWFRIALHYKVAYIDEVLAYYRLSPSSITANLDRLLKGNCISSPSIINRARLRGWSGCRLWETYTGNWAIRSSGAARWRRPSAAIFGQ
jgi:hypothetical protein